MSVRSHQMLVAHHSNLQYLTPLENIRKGATLPPWALALINDGNIVEDVARLQRRNLRFQRCSYGDDT